MEKIRKQLDKIKQAIADLPETENSQELQETRSLVLKAQIKVHEAIKKG